MLAASDGVAPRSTALATASSVAERMALAATPKGPSATHCAARVTAAVEASRAHTGCGWRADALAASTTDLPNAASAVRLPPLDAEGVVPRRKDRLMAAELADPFKC